MQKSRAAMGVLTDAARRGKNVMISRDAIKQASLFA
jgi:hypothetical protein